MLIWSISSASATPTPTMAQARIAAASSSRASALSCLESANPLGRPFAGRMTAAATTGPAQGPRPASSIPQMPLIRREWTQIPRPRQTSNTLDIMTIKLDIRRPGGKYPCHNG